MANEAANGGENGLVGVGARSTTGRVHGMSRAEWTCVWVLGLLGFLLSVILAFVSGPAATIQKAPDGGRGDSVAIAKVLAWQDTLVFHNVFSNSMALGFTINVNASQVPAEGLSRSLRLNVTWRGYSNDKPGTMSQSALVTRDVDCAWDGAAGVSCSSVLLFRDNFLAFDNYNIQVRVQPEDRAAFGFVRSVNFVYLYESYSYAVRKVQLSYLTLGMACLGFFWWFWVCTTDRAINRKLAGGGGGGAGVRDADADEEGGEQTRAAGCGALCDRILCCCLPRGCFARTCLPYQTSELRWVALLMGLLFLYNRPFFAAGYIESTTWRAVLLATDTVFQAAFLTALMGYWLFTFEDLADLRVSTRMFVFKVLYLLAFWIGSSALYCAVLYRSIDDRFYDYWWDASLMTAARVFVAIFGATYLAWTFSLALLAARRMGMKPMGQHIIFLCHIWRLAIIGVGIAAGSVYASAMESDRIAIFFQFFFTFYVLEVAYLFRPVLLPASMRHDLELQPHDHEARSAGHAEFTQVSPRNARDLQQPAVDKDGTRTEINLAMV
jgi:hypothetical protein